MSIHSDDILKDVLLASIKEQRAKRRWGIFFKLIMILILLSLIYVFFSQNTKVIKAAGSDAYAALIDINGVISSDSQANADNVVTGIDQAFTDPNAKGIILRINSPGGSPVQASEIYNEIMRQRGLHPKIKIYAVCTDICTSAAYYIASATNAIYANPSSLVGSIGVLIDSFGFEDTLKKLGIQRRLLTAGDHKGFLDPFSPLKPEDEKIADNMLKEIHTTFIQDVMKGRGARLKISSDTFSGLAWTGVSGLKMGLIDGYGSAGDVSRNIIKTKDIEDFTVKPNPIDMFAQKLGASFAVHLEESFGLWGNKKLS